MAYACPNCGVQVMEGEAFCGECGADLSALQTPAAGWAGTEGTEQSGLLCGVCGRGLIPGEGYCGWCGTAVAGSAQAEGPPPPPQPTPGPQGYGGASSGGAASTFSQGGGEVAARFQQTWSDRLLRAPLVFLAMTALGLLLPQVTGLTGSEREQFGDSFNIADIPGISEFSLLLVPLVVLLLLVLYATSPGLGSAPLLLVVGIAFILAVPATLWGGLLIAATILVDEEGGSVGIGGVLVFLGSVGLFVTTSRLGVRDLLQR